MEAYTLWWNGDCLRNFLKLNQKVSYVHTSEQILKTETIPIEDRQKIVAFRKNSAMLAWGLIYVMHMVHKAKIIHNDLTPSNILLHFPPNDKEAVYIGVCDWGMASRIVENKPSYYGYKNEDDR